MARKKSPMMPEEDAAIYTRYSSHAQNDASIEQQIAECTAYAKANNLRIVATYEDRAISGRSDNRPEFQRMMRHAEARKFQVVIAYKSNRIARNMLHALAYEEKLARFGIRVVYAKEEFGNNAAGRFALRTMMNVNQFYSENMAEDIQRGLYDSANQCKVVTTIPYGYKRGEDGRHAIHDQEAAVVQEIFQRVAQGDTLAAIADDLNSRGIQTRRKGPWNKNSFRAMLSNEKYLGVYTYGNVRIEGGMPQIIPKELFYIVQRVVATKPTKVNGRRTENGDYILTGKLFCGHCLSPMVGISGTSRSGELHHYYACQKHRLEKTCKKKSVRREWIETLVAEALAGYVLKDDVIEWIADQVIGFKKRFEDDSQIHYLEEKLAEAQKASANIMKAIEAGIFNNQTQARMLELEEEQRTYSNRLAEERALIPNVDRDQIVYFLHHLKETGIDSKAAREKLFDMFLLAVYLYDDHIKIAFNWDQGNKAIEVPIEEIADEDSSTDGAVNVRLSSVRAHSNMLIRTPASIVMVGRVFVLSFSFDDLE